MWKLIERFKNVGFKSEYLYTYQKLSNKIKQTVPGISLSKDLDNARALSIGHYFPELILKKLDLENIFLETINNNVSYTLIDFWFSKCTPCLREFPDIKKLLESYKELKVIGISVDKTDDIINWQTIIKDRKLNWLNYLDENGILSQGMGINSFPTNFLLNSKGEIIFKNISIENLQELLKKTK